MCGALFGVPLQIRLPPISFRTSSQMWLQRRKSQQRPSLNFSFRDTYQIRGESDSVLQSVQHFHGRSRVCEASMSLEGGSGGQFRSSYHNFSVRRGWWWGEGGWQSNRSCTGRCSQPISTTTFALLAQLLRDTRMSMWKDNYVSSKAELERCSPLQAPLQNQVLSLTLRTCSCLRPEAAMVVSCALRRDFLRLLRDTERRSLRMAFEYA